jgi:hypothetical protein
MCFDSSSYCQNLAAVEKIWEAVEHSLRSIELTFLVPLIPELTIDLPKRGEVELEEGKIDCTKMTKLSQKSRQNVTSLGDERKKFSLALFSPLSMQFQSLFIQFV